MGKRKDKKRKQMRKRKQRQVLRVIEQMLLTEVSDVMQDRILHGAGITYIPLKES